MKKLLIASFNPAKIADYKRYLNDLPYKIVSLRDLNISTVIEETKNTYKENAILKAEGYGKLLGLISLADDAGLEIDALGGEPGVKSRNWLGHRMSDEEMINEVLARMEGIPQDKRTARFVAVIALFIPPNKIYTKRIELKGTISTVPHPKRVPGYPFRSIFFIPQFKKFYCDLTKEEYEMVNHRKKAILEIKKILLKL